MKPIRKLKCDDNKMFLTFDDGPCPQTTEDVLRILNQNNAKATFFVIAEQALLYASIVQDLLSEGHQLGNHSPDHAFSHYFRGSEHLKQWIERGHKLLQDRFAVNPVGFRSPAGVVTPPLRQALADLQYPWIHWQHRFFDTSVPMSWMLGFHNYQQGDILLLHDRQRPWLRKGFLRHLPCFLQRLEDKGFDIQGLSPEDFSHDR